MQVPLCGVYIIFKTDFVILHISFFALFKQALYKCERCDNLPKTLIFLKAVDKDVITAPITPRGTKTVRRADYFESKQTGLCDVC